MKVLNLVLLVAISYAAVTLFAFAVAERIMFQPPASSYTRSALPISMVPVGDDSVAVLYLPNESARYTMIYSHGNAEDLGHLRGVLQDLRANGFAVLAYDYRGYGLSTPVRPTARRATEDVAAVYRHATTTLGIEPSNLILYGRSVGSGPTLELAASHDAAGVILESAFTSAYRVMTRVAVLPFDRYPNIERVRDLQRPLLVIHGTADDIIPASHGRQLHATAPGPKQALWAEGAGHNDLMYVAGARYFAALRDFARLLDELHHAADPEAGPHDS
jgi:abhydrolase domain-containing protein 17